MPSRSSSALLIFRKQSDSLSSGKHSPVPSQRLTFSQKTLIIALAFINFCETLNYSIIAPFFPNEAAKKGVSQATYGFVFGVFELVVFITSPIYGRYVNVIGSKFLLNAGIFVSSCTSIMFGFLDKISSPSVFIALAFVVRSVEALGSAAFITASFSIVANNFPENVGTILGLLETFTGLGIMLGPVIGGSFYTIGGYTLPFVVMGGILLLASFITIFILPQQLDENKKMTKSFWKFLKIPSILIDAVVITLGALSIGFIEPTLEPHIRQFDLSAVQVGSVFLTSAGIYAFTAPAWGYVADKKINPKILMIIGCVLVGLSFFFIGPSPIIKKDTTLWLVIVSLVLHGIGVGCQLVPPFTDALREAIASGFPDNFETYGLVAGMFSSLFALGAFIGPTLGAVLMDHLTMGWTGTIFFGVEILLIVVIVIYFICKKKNAEQSEEKQPLLLYRNQDLTLEK